MSELKDKLPTLESLKLVNDTLSVKIEKNTQNISQLTEENAELKQDLSDIQTDFETALEFHKGNNLFDKTADGAVQNGYWYWMESGSPRVGAKVVAKPSSPYAAIKIPIDGESAVSFKQAYNNPTDNTYSRFYIWFVVDENMIVTKFMPNYAFTPYFGGYTVTDIPEGSKYLLVSAVYYQKAVDAGFEFMANSGTVALNYEPYTTGYYSVAKADAISSNVRFHAPDKYDVPNSAQVLQVFYRNLIDALNPNCYYVKAKCPVGNAFDKYFEFPKGRTDGTYHLELELYDYNNTLVSSADIPIVVNSKTLASAGTKNILCVGDSLTTGGVWVKEFARMVTQTGGSPAGYGWSNVHFVGTRSIDGVGYEGYGGWRFSTYNAESVSSNVRNITCSHDKTEAQDQHSIYKDSTGGQWKLETIESDRIRIIGVTTDGTGFPETGTLTWVSGGVNHSDIVFTANERAVGNPFWDSATSKVDFAKYAQKIGVSSIDYVFALLGWNDVETADETYRNDVQTFIDNVHASFPNCKIVLIGLQMPSRNGLGNNYGANGVHSDYKRMIDHVFHLDAVYKDIAKSNSNVFSVNLSGQFDTDHNMPTVQKAVNNRSTIMEDMQSNGVHPATAGYMQIADVALRKLTAII